MEHDIKVKLSKPLNQDEVDFLNNMFSQLPTHHFSYLQVITKYINNNPNLVLEMFSQLKEKKENLDLDIDNKYPFEANFNSKYFMSSLDYIFKIFPEATLGTHYAFLLLSLNTKSTVNGDTIQFTNDSIIFPNIKNMLSQHTDKNISAISSQLALLNAFTSNIQYFLPGTKMFSQNPIVFDNDLKLEFKSFISREDLKNPIINISVFNYDKANDSICVTILNSNKYNSINSSSKYNYSLTNPGFYCDDLYFAISDDINPINPKTFNIIKKIPSLDIINENTSKSSYDYKNIKSTVKI